MFKRKAEAEDATAAKSVSTANGTGGDRKATFTLQLTALNSQFAAWVADQSVSAAQELWTDGVEDYLTYAKQLLADFSDVLEGANGQAEAAAPAANAGGSSTFGIAAGAGPGAGTSGAAGSSKPPLAPGGLFGSSSAGAAGGPSSIFGALPSTGAAQGPGSSAPLFGGVGGSGTASAANSGSGLFNVPSTGTLGSSFTTGGAGADNDGDDAEEEQQDAEPSVALEAVKGAEILAKQRTKLMSMMLDKKWKDKGQGTLTLRRATGEDAAGKRPYLVFTTDSGRVLVNAPLLPGMKPTVNAKAAASVVMFLISCVDGKEDRGMHLFRCDSADAAKQLIKAVTELAA